MSSRSLNKAILIGNLTRDPELRYTPAGTAVCTFGLATNRSWTTQTGETKEETEFHRIVAWNKLGELCAQLLVKGRKVYVEGRLTTHSWTGQDGNQRTSTEVVIEDMIILDSKRRVTEEDVVSSGQDVVTPAVTGETTAGSQAGQVNTSTGSATSDDQGTKQKKTAKKEEKMGEKADNEDITPDDIPF